MVPLSIEDLVLYQALKQRGKRDDKVATVAAGLLITSFGDAGELLEYIRTGFPSYTRHNLQHSLLVIDRFSRLLSDKALTALTSVEILTLFLSAAFHDVGMASPHGGREDHASQSVEIFQKFVTERLSSLSEYHARLKALISFVMEAHALTWEALASHTKFHRSETIMYQVVRPSVLAVLLRLGDLLDLDADRTPQVVRSVLPEFFDDSISRLHHSHHTHVTSFHVSANELRVEVESYSREEHELWSTWFNYIRTDVLSANTFVFVGPLSVFRLPAPTLTITPAAGATYELWPLRFEIDQAGRIWDVLSKSVYTGKFDFVRELIQNAIDASLMRMFIDTETELTQRSPRAWITASYIPTVLAFWSSTNGFFEVEDFGIGMDREDLQTYLFQIARSGYQIIPSNRTFQYPAIAAFGIGFISVLTRANRIIVETRKPVADRRSGGFRVRILGRSREAYVERLEDGPQGTRVRLEQVDPFIASDLVEYLRDSFKYPSADLVLVDLDELNLLAQHAELFKIPISTAVSALLHDDRVLPVTPGALITDVRYLYERLHSHKVSMPTLLVDRLREANEQVLYIQRNSTVSGDVARSIVIKLDAYLRFLNAEFIDGTTTVLWRGKSIIWVPLTFTDYDIGIEWYSVHGFILRDRCVCERLGRLTDREYRVGDSGLDDLEIIDAFPDRGEILRPTTEGFLFLSDRTTHGMPFDEELRQRSTTTPAEEQDEHEYMLAHARLVGFLQDLDEIDDAVFQDGLRTNIRGSSLAPIGVCVARCNLTADARFALNISRLAIDETPAVLSTWVTGVGEVIQRRVLDTLVNYLSSLGIVLEHSRVLLPDYLREDALSRSCYASVTHLIHHSQLPI
jgi:hypothetical protein